MQVCLFKQKIWHGKWAFGNGLVIMCCKLSCVLSCFISQGFLLKIAEWWREVQITMKHLMFLNWKFALLFNISMLRLKDLGFSDIQFYAVEGNLKPKFLNCKTTYTLSQK